MRTREIPPLKHEIYIVSMSTDLPMSFGRSEFLRQQTRGPKGSSLNLEVSVRGDRSQMVEGKTGVAQKKQVRSRAKIVVPTHSPKANCKHFMPFVFSLAIVFLLILTIENGS